MPQKPRKTFDTISQYPDGTYRETYPEVTWCPACHSENGYQSFDIWICHDCGEWPYIEPITKEKA